MSKPFILDEDEQAQVRAALLLDLSRLLRRLFWLTLLWGWPLGMVFLRPNEFDFYQTFGFEPDVLAYPILGGLTMWLYTWYKLYAWSRIYKPYKK